MCVSVDVGMSYLSVALSLPPSLSFLSIFVSPFYLSLINFFLPI